MTDPLTAAGFSTETLTDPTNTELQREIVAQSNDLRQPLYQDESRQARNALYAETVDEQASITAACQAAPWDPQIHDDDELPIWLAAARLLPVLQIVNAQQTDPNTTAFHWAKVRCLFAGAGFQNHDAIAAVLGAVYPVCDLVPNETEQEWIKALQKARDICGWPVHLARVNWTALVRGMAWIDKSEPVSSWHRTVAMMHILKHVRTRGERLAIIYGGVASLIPASDSNVIALNKNTLQMVIQALGCPLGQGKDTHPLTSALTQMLKQVSIDRLLSQRPLAELPGTVIAGPWSSVEPDPMASNGFVQSGLRLSGVWNASNGAVREYTGSPIDAVSWAWNLTNPADFAGVKHALMASMPTTYPTAWPGDMLLADFPNIDLSWATDPECAKVLLELPIFASLLRRSGEPLSREFPFVVFLPDKPTMEDSVNQGKTAITRTLVRSMSPGAPTVVPPDTSSAPDNRAFVDVIAQYGTAGLDEWAPPQSRSHPLSHQNLQTLCTGGGVTFGRVLENSGMITLRHSLVAGCKAVDFPPDMVTRTFMWPLRLFTDQERNRTDVKNRVDSGQAALQLRLAALHQIETNGIGQLLATAPGSTNSALRFDAHAALAGVLYELRTKTRCTTMAKTISEMRHRLHKHVSEAATSGVLSAQETGGYLTVRLPDIFSGCGPDIIGMMQQDMGAMSAVSAKQIGQGWNTPSQMLEALRKSRGFPTLQAMLPAISGGRMRASDRQILMAMTRSLRTLLPEQGVFEIPDTGWTIERGTDVSGSVRIRLAQPTLLQSSCGTNDTWMLDDPGKPTEPGDPDGLSGLAEEPMAQPASNQGYSDGLSLH